MNDKIVIANTALEYQRQFSTAISITRNIVVISRQLFPVHNLIHAIAAVALGYAFAKKVRPASNQI